MTTIKLKNGSGAPDAADLVQGEVALDLTNKRIYSENASGTVIEMGTSPSTIDINAGTIDGVTMATSDITVGAGKTLDVSAGTLTLANDQISGDKIQGGTIGSVTISTLTATSADINGGTIDGTTIGGASAGAGTFTTITGTSFVSSGDMTFGDDDKAIFGAGSDLQISHSGTSSRIQDVGTGNLIIDTNGTEIQLTSGSISEYMLRAVKDGAVTLYYDNAAKLATTTTGIDVTGTVTADGLTVDNAVATITNNDIDNGATLRLDNAASSSSWGLGKIIGTLEYYLSADPSTTEPVRAKIELEQNNATTTYPSTADLNFYTASVNTLSKNMTIAAGGDISFYEDTGTTPKLFWDASAERLGIGTASPSSALSVYRESTADQFYVDDGTSKFYFSPNGTGEGIIKLNTANAIRFLNAGGERLRIDSSGNLGLSVTPSAWGSLFKALQVGRASLFSNISAGDYGIYANSFSDGTDDIYIGSTGAGKYKFNTTSRAHQWFTAPSGTAGDPITFTQAMTLDASGNLLVGTTDPDIGTNSGVNVAGHYLDATGTAVFGKNGNRPLVLNRGTNDGNIAEFRKDGAPVGSIGTINTGNLFISGNSSHAGLQCGSSAITPMYGVTDSDNAVDLGALTLRFDDVYATNGTIQTSDRNEKQDIEELSEAEQRVAVAAKGLLRKFRWKSKVEEKGDDARIHFGIIAQDLQAAFEDEGLDAGRYAMFIHSTWTDEETGEERSRMGVRYSELLAFIIAAI